MQNQTTVDHSAIKTGQLLTIATLLAAFILGHWELVAILAVIFLITALINPLGPFVLVYRLLLKPWGIVRPAHRQSSAPSFWPGSRSGQCRHRSMCSLCRVFLRRMASGVGVNRAYCSFIQWLVYRMLSLLSDKPNGIARLLCPQTY